MHKHLRRLNQVWIDNPIYFITTCTYKRIAILACETVASILTEEWRNARVRHGWRVGHYVVMPDHVHFFCAPDVNAKPLSTFIASWKEWTSKSLKSQLLLTSAIWQPEFFDHVLRSTESYGEKCDYVRTNPVRVGLVEDPDSWPSQGEIEQLHF